MGLLGRLRGAPSTSCSAERPGRDEAYASLLRYDTLADVAAACRHFVAQGFRMLKLHQIDVASVRAAREAVGPDVELMLDTNCPWNPAGAIAMARALEPYRLFWLEEPVWPPEDYEGLARVAASPIADRAGRERVDGVRVPRDHRAAGGQILQPSITKVGGISEFKKIVALAQAAGLTVVPHSFYFGPARRPCTSRRPSAAACRSSSHRRAGDPVPGRTITAVDGWVDVPMGPGLGVELNEDALRRHPFVPGRPSPLC